MPLLTLRAGIPARLVSGTKSELNVGVDAVFGEILTTLAKIDWLVANGEKVLRPDKRALSLLLAHKLSEVSRTECAADIRCDMNRSVQFWLWCPGIIRSTTPCLPFWLHSWLVTLSLSSAVSKLPGAATGSLEASKLVFVHVE